MKIKTLAWKQLSHSAWLAILTCYFSGVFVCNLCFLLIVWVNVVSCRVTFLAFEILLFSKNTHWFSVMESRDMVSVARPIFASLGLEGFRSRLGLESFRSRDFEYCKEMVY